MNASYRLRGAGFARTSKLGMFDRNIFTTAPFFLVCAIALSGCAGTSSAPAATSPTPAALSITTSTLPSKPVNTAYSASVQATGGTPPYSFALHSGTLPSGITLNSNGSLKGMPPASGIFTIAIQAADSSATALTTSASYTFSIYGTTVQVSPATTLATVPQTGFGMHTSVYDAGLTDVSLLPSLLEIGGITTLRYPGGVYSDDYHWAQNSLTPWFASATPACSVAQNGFLAPNTDFGNFIKTLQATGTQALITVNYGTSLGDALGSKTTGSYGPNTCSQPFTSGQPQEAAAWVAYANGSTSNLQTIGVDAVGFDWKTVGYWAALRAATPLPIDDGYNFLRIGQSTPVGIKDWEVGNEIFYNGFSNNQNYETDLHGPYVYSNGYGSDYSSRAGVANLSPTAYGGNAAKFVEAMRAVDNTIKVGLDLSSPDVDPVPASWNPAAIAAVCAVTTFDFGIFHYYPGTFNAVTAAQLLKLPQSDIPSLLSNARAQIAQSCVVEASTMQFFITETGPNGSYANGVPSQITGLYAANIYLAALAAGVSNIDWLELHSGNYLAQGTEAPGPAYYGIQLAHLLAGVGDTMVSSSSSTTTLLSYATIKSNGQRGIFLLNADPANSVTVQITPGGSSLSGSATQYSYGISTTQSASALASSGFAVSGSAFSVTIPPHTATTILFP